MTPLEKAIQIISDGNQAKFARMVSEINDSPLSQQLVNFWLDEKRPNNKKRCGPQFAVAIAKLTNGEVTEHELRPDVFPPQKERAA